MISAHLFQRCCITQVAIEGPYLQCMCSTSNAWKAIDSFIVSPVLSISELIAAYLKDVDGLKLSDSMFLLMTSNSLASSAYWLMNWPEIVSFVRY